MRSHYLRSMVGTGALLAFAACTDSGGSDTAGSGAGAATGSGGSGGAGTTSSAASSSTSTTTSGGGGAAPGPSDLPVPSGPADLPRPSGALGNLKVVPWAGFKSAATYTLDDAQPSHTQHLAELKATGAPMTFYIHTFLKDSQAGFEETWKDALSAGFEIANHTKYHCLFEETCNGSQSWDLEEELDSVTDYIINTIGAPGVWTFAYPNGDMAYEPAVKERFPLARGSQNGTIAPSQKLDAWDLPVYLAMGGEEEDVFDAVIDDAHDSGHWVIFLLHSILPGDNWYAGVDIGTITGSVAHAQSFKDVWIGTMIGVGAYWLGQETLENASSRATAGGTTWTWTLPPHFPPGKFLRVTVDGGTLSQGGAPLPWDGHGYYEVALDAGTLTLSP
jgi:peptidoglycan/xylan/chitin deacetylase (PgdA/CDA1 family)